MEHSFRDYAMEPLSEAEIRDLLVRLGTTPAEAARRRDPAWREVEDAGGDAIVAAMARRPGLLERPIAVRGEKAVIARPPERVRELL